MMDLLYIFLFLIIEIWIIGVSYFSVRYGYSLIYKPYLTKRGKFYYIVLIAFWFIYFKRLNKTFV